MLKNLYEKGFVNMEKILIREYQKINLDLSELTILLFLFNCYEKKIFSSLILARKTNLSKNEVEAILERLMKKKFFSISQDQKDNKIIEIFNLDNTFIKIEELYLEKEKKIKIVQKGNFITETIENLEKLKGKVLVGYELEMIKSWYYEQNYSHQDIMKTISYAFANQKNSLYYIERILNQKNNLQIEKDEKADKILHKFFQKIK